MYTWIGLTYFSESHIVFTGLSANVVDVVSAETRVAAARIIVMVDFKYCIPTKVVVLGLAESKRAGSHRMDGYTAINKI